MIAVRLGLSAYFSRGAGKCNKDDDGDKNNDDKDKDDNDNKFGIATDHFAASSLALPKRPDRRGTFG